VNLLSPKVMCVGGMTHVLSVKAAATVNDILMQSAKYSVVESDDWRIRHAIMGPVMIQS